MKIPFTNFHLKLLQANQERLRGSKLPIMSGRFSTNPSSDMSGYKISVDSFFSAYRNSGDIYGCVRELRENVGAGGHDWKNPKDPIEDAPDKIITDVESVMNYSMPFRQLKSRMIRDWAVAGNNYLAAIKSQDKKIIYGFQPIDPRTIAIVADQHGTIHKYIQRSPSGTAAVIFEPDEIFHWKNDTDPYHELFGLSPIEPILWEARTDIASMISNYFFFENNAMPSVLFILDETLSDDEATAAIEGIKSQFSGPENRHKSAVMKNIKEIKEINVSHKDMEFLESRKFTTEKICAAYGVPKAILGYTDTVNYSNAEMMFKKFIEGTVQPIEASFEEFINLQILPALGMNGLVEFKFDPQTLETQKSLEERGLKELAEGAITLRQYKMKTGQDISEEDDQTPGFDDYIIHNGAAAMNIEDIGAQAFLDPNDEQSAKRFLAMLENFKQKPNA